MTPVILFVIMVWWAVDQAIPTLLLKGVPEENQPYIWGARLLMLAISALILFLVKLAWDKKELKAKA